VLLTYFSSGDFIPGVNKLGKQDIPYHSWAYQTALQLTPL